MDFLILKVLGEGGIIGVVGLLTFLFSLRYSKEIFQWVENRTIGTRNYIIEKLDFLFIEFNPDKLTFYLLLLSIGNFFIVLILFGLMGLWGWGFFLSIAAGFFGFYIPRPFVDFLVERRIKQYSGQMVDALTLLANGIRAGLSVPQALGMVADELPNPISQEYTLLLQQNRIGVTLEDCFDNLAKRIPTEDNDMFVSSVNILRETGGNLSETFDTIIDIIRERIRLQQKIDTFTANGRFQGFLVASMPLLLGLLYASDKPEVMISFFNNPLGILVFLLIIGLDFVGLFIILKIVAIKV